MIKIRLMLSVFLDLWTKKGFLPSFHVIITIVKIEFGKYQLQFIALNYVSVV
jgi:hypothetical protein